MNEELNNKTLGTKNNKNSTINEMNKNGFDGI